MYGREKTVLFLIITEGKKPLSQSGIERGVKFSITTKKMLEDIKRAGISNGFMKFCQLDCPAPTVFTPELLLLKE